MVISLEEHMGFRVTKKTSKRQVEKECVKVVLSKEDDHC